MWEEQLTCHSTVQQQVAAADWNSAASVLPCFSPAPCPSPSVSADNTQWLNRSQTLLASLTKTNALYSNQQQTRFTYLLYNNEQILGMVDKSRSLLETLRKRQKNWIGHVLRRHDS